MGGDPEPVEMILRSTLTSIWGALPHAATADICDTVKKVTLEIVGIKNLSLRFKRSICLQHVIYRTCPDSSCSRAPISTSELLLMERGHPGTSCLRGGDHSCEKH